MNGSIARYALRIPIPYGGDSFEVGATPVQWPAAPPRPQAVAAKGCRPADGSLPPRPLHGDVTAFLLARGANPLRPFNGVPVFVEAEIRGHWLATEIMQAPTGRGRKPAGPEEGPR